jgi:hypothetical protein
MIGCGTVFCGWSGSCESVTPWISRRHRPIRVGGPVSLERRGECKDARRISGEIDGETVRPFIHEAASGFEIPDLVLFGPFLLVITFR